MPTKRIGIIGGTGLTRLEGPQITQVHDVNTVLGTPSSSVQQGTWNGCEVLFMARHGHPHALPPHKVNYRANLLALQELGADAIIAVNAVGGIHADMDAGAIVIPHQLVDLTWGRESTYFDGSYKPLEHIDFTDPFDADIRQHLLGAAAKLQLPVSDFGVVAVTQGPRLETTAEIDYLERIGCDVVGMTSMPEAVLARELGIPYASVCLVVNPAAGRSDAVITMEDIQRVLDAGMGQVRDLIEAALPAV
ncbi:S-methyl-5'-thioinosine phosphorylase [Oceanobacter mangrovi]|uniref:S-methyl-5'-thioinosine phosphorylase n=1 Tax=Oceanobacter mangrovi TaxID=2862510 RepID=UPI001C8D931C|nr:S-methyl-5'-thioinosine phosphorylase [Oceanobacter mangrovi]